MKETKTYYCCCFATKLCPDLCDPMDCSPPGSSVHGIFQQEYWSGLLFPSPGDLPDPGIEPKSPALVAGFFTSEQSGKATDIVRLKLFSGKHI